jgi:membrane-bound lytic murein transglycosylase D
MSPAEAARRTGMSEASLREVNKIPPKMLVKAGSTLLVPRGEHVHDDVSERLADSASLNLAPDAPPLRRVSLKAGKGDTVAAVAARYKVRAEQVAQWNKVGSGARFKPGQAIVVYTAFTPKAAAPQARAQAPARSARVAKAAPAPRLVKVAAKPAPKAKGGKGRTVIAAATP